MCLKCTLSVYHLLLLLHEALDVRFLTQTTGCPIRPCSAKRQSLTRKAVKIISRQPRPLHPSQPRSPLTYISFPLSSLSCSPSNYSTHKNAMSSLDDIFAKKRKAPSSLPSTSAKKKRLIEKPTKTIQIKKSGPVVVEKEIDQEARSEERRVGKECPV